MPLAKQEVERIRERYRERLAEKDKRIAELEKKIRHCDECGSDWVDNGLNAGCTCKEIKRLRALAQRTLDRSCTNPFCHYCRHEAGADLAKDGE